MKCPRCLNEDPSWFYQGSKGWYCRRCIGFGRVLLEEIAEPVSLHEIHEKAEEYTLRYPLSSAQVKIASSLMKEIEKGDVLIQAVCGAGKTEIVIPTIAEYLSRGKRVCFAIARRQVVLEVAKRLQSYFTNAKVIPVCQGYTSQREGDLIVSTTHQLYYYYHTFDLLILDEPDAFPFRGDPVLHGIARTSCIGNIIYLTATPDEHLKKRVEKGTLKRLCLQSRPHGKPIPVPKIMIAPKWILMIILIHWIIQHEEHPRMVFVPTRKKAVFYGKMMNLFFHVSVCTSQSENRDEIIESFRNEKHGIIICTTVLERGVTIPHADVCVLEADHAVYDEAGLVQMAGRAGRDFQDPTGDVLFLCNQKSEKCQRCVDSLLEANAECAV